MNSRLESIVRFASLAALCLLLGGMAPADAQEPKPKPKPAPSPYDPPKQPAKRSHFCSEKADGWYCGENGEARLFKCKDGQINDSKECAGGCDESRNQCKPSR